MESVNSAIMLTHFMVVLVLESRMSRYVTRRRKRERAVCYERYVIIISQVSKKLSLSRKMNMLLINCCPKERRMLIRRKKPEGRTRSLREVR